MAAMFVNGVELNEHLYRGPSKDASYQVLIHLARRFQRRRFFRNQPIRNKNGLWRPLFVNGSGRNEQSLSSVDASYQVSVHLTKRFQRWRFKKNRLIRNKNCLWRPCLIMDRDKMSNLYKGPSLDASYQVSVHSLPFARHAIESFLTW